MRHRLVGQANARRKGVKVGGPSEGPVTVCATGLSDARRLPSHGDGRRRFPSLAVSGHPGLWHGLSRRDLEMMRRVEQARRGAPSGGAPRRATLSRAPRCLPPQATRTGTKDRSCAPPRSASRSRRPHARCPERDMLEMGLASAPPRQAVVGLEYERLSSSSPAWN